MRSDALNLYIHMCTIINIQVAPAIKHLQEAMRNDPDNSGYRTEIKKWRSMEAQKEAGNDAFKKGNYQEVGSGPCLCYHARNSILADARI